MQPFKLFFFKITNPEPGGIKFPDFKASGTSLRSQRVSGIVLKSEECLN